MIAMTIIMLNYLLIIINISMIINCLKIIVTFIIIITDFLFFGNPAKCNFMILCEVEIYYFFKITFLNNFKLNFILIYY